MKKNVLIAAITVLILAFLAFLSYVHEPGTSGEVIRQFPSLQNSKVYYKTEGVPSMVPTMDQMFKDSVKVAPNLFTYERWVVIPPTDYLQTLDRAQLEDLFHRYVENIQWACHNMIHYGLEQDGGYYLCEDYDLKTPCMMYSFGTRNDYSFDDRIADTVGCDVHSFDPGDGQKDHQRSKRIWFHAIGLDGKTRDEKVGRSNWKVYSLHDIRRNLNHTERSLDILKIDTEGMIWETLVDLTTDRGKMHDVKMLIVELHTNFPDSPPNAEYRTKPEYVEHLDSLRKLYDLGFRIYYFHRWHICRIKGDNGIIRTGCHDVHFIRI